MSFKKLLSITAVTALSAISLTSFAKSTFVGSSIMNRFPTPITFTGTCDGVKFPQTIAGNSSVGIPTSSVDWGTCSALTYTASNDLTCIFSYARDSGMFYTTPDSACSTTSDHSTLVIGG